MIHPRILKRSTLIATIVQLVWAGVGIVGVGEPFLMIGRLAVAAGGGYVYGQSYSGSETSGALGGMLTGGGSVLPAVILSVLAGTSAGSMIPMATGAAMLAGGVGGALGGWFGAWQRKDFD